MKLTVKLLKQFNACQDGINFVERNKLIGLDLSHIPPMRSDNNKFVSWFKSVLKNTTINCSGNQFHYKDPDNEKLNYIVKFNDNGDRTEICYYNSEHPNTIYKFYNEYNNIILEESSTGDIVVYQYDSNQNLILSKDSNGYTEWYKYDDKNNLIQYKNSNYVLHLLKYDNRNNLINKVIIDNTQCSTQFSEFWQEFDENDNMIHFRNTNKIEYWQEFDKNGNVIHYKTNDSDEEYWQEFDQNNNLILHKTPLKTHKIKSDFYPNGQLKQYGRLKIPLIEFE